MPRFLFVLLPLLSCSASGNNYPERYASALCGSLYECISDPNDIEFFFGYDDEKECREEVAEDIRGDASYDGFEEGDRVYDPEAGEACLDEVAQIRDDADCGSMSWISFGLDAFTDACFNVFPKAEDD